MYALLRFTEVAELVFAKRPNADYNFTLTVDACHKINKNHVFFLFFLFLFIFTLYLAYR